MIIKNNRSNQIVKVSHLLEKKLISQSQLTYGNLAISGNDNKLFIDPILIYGDSQRDEIAKKCWETLSDYFNTLCSELANGKFSRESNILEHLSEKNEFRLGHSQYKDGKIAFGTGCTKEMVYSIFERIGFEKCKEMIEKNLIKDPMDIVVFVKGFGEDRLSDLITNVIAKELQMYTESIIKQSTEFENLTFLEKTSWYWDKNTHSWKEFSYNQMLDFNKKPLTLIPKRFLTNKYSYSASRFFQGIVLEHIQKLEQLKNPNAKKKTKKTIKSELKNKEDSIVFIKDFIIEYTLKEQPDLAYKFRNQQKNGSLGTNYLGYLSDNRLTEIINQPYKIAN